MYTKIDLFSENLDNSQTNQFSKQDLIKQKILAVSTCPLKNAGARPVMPIGTGASRVMFIGEAPGAKEEELGEPFVGASGNFLNTILLPSVNLNRQNIYLTNIVKCRPPENRDPTDEEKKAWSSVLLYEIDLVKPKLIVCLGRHSMSFFLGERAKISQIHGQIQLVSIYKLGNLQQYILPLYHPAVALYNSNMVDILKTDFLKIKEFLSSFN